MKLFYVAVSFVFFSMAQAQTPRLPKLEKPKSRFEDKLKGALNGGSGKKAALPDVNEAIAIKSKANEQLGDCTGNCGLSNSVASAAERVEELKPEARKNISAALTRAKALQEKGISVSAAQEQALTELGLDPKKVEEGCKK